MDSWRYAKDRPPARVSMTLEERMLGGPAASATVSSLLRRYKGPDQDLAAALERCCPIWCPQRSIGTSVVVPLSHMLKQASSSATIDLLQYA